MEPIYLLLLNFFAVFLLVNENILIERISKLKLGVALFNLLVSFLVVFTYSLVIESSIYNMIYRVFVVLNILFFAYGLFTTLKASGLKANYYHLFIKSIKELKNNIYFVIDENERFVDISDSFLEDIKLTKDKVIGRKFFDIINKSLDFLKMNDKEINNNYLEQHYIRYIATINSQKAVEIEFTYKTVDDKKEIIHVVEKPIFINNKFKGRIVIGEKISSLDSTKSKHKYHNLLNEYNDLQIRFISTIELTSEGVFYLNEETNELWGTDRLKEILGLDMNVANIKDLYLNIHPGDLENYDKQMRIKKSKGEYRATYRYKSKNSYRWILEEGKLVDTTDGKLTIGIIRELDSGRVTKKVTFPDELELKLAIKEYIKEKRPFGYLRLNLDQIKDMNVKYGREATSHIVDEFVKKLKRNYTRKTSKVYELSIHEYAIIIDDLIDFSVVTKSLLSGSDLFNLNIKMGEMDMSMEPSIGIVEYPNDTGSLDELIKACESAVNMAKKDYYKHKFCFYKDIRDVLN
ncbi:diguanylate cyclase [Mycoplasmatota bacterium]|nr:diguanylate cyclase [Mycoplasmatota bacterium]